MITPAKFNNALYALHLLLTRMRYMAYTEEAHQQIAVLLDYAEMLPRFIASSEDNTKEFRSYLESIAKHFPACAYILNKFDETTTPDSW